MFHQTSLQVTAPWSFNCCINQTLSSCHTVKVKFLLPQPTQEAISNESAGSGVGVKGIKRRQSFSVDHNGHPSPLQLLLSQHDGHLGMVNVGPLGSCDSHHWKIVEGKLLVESWQTFLYHFGTLIVDVMFVLSIKLFVCSCLIDNFVLKMFPDRLWGIQMNLFFNNDGLAILIAFVLISSHPWDSLWHLFFVYFAYLLDCLLVDHIKHLPPLFLNLFLEQKVIQPTGKPVHLHVVEEKLVKAGHQCPSCAFSIHLNKRVDKTVVRFRSYLVLIDNSLYKLVVNKYNLWFFLVILEVVCWYFGLWLHR